MDRNHFISDLIALCVEHDVILSGEACDEGTNLAVDVLASPRGAVTTELVDWPDGKPGPEHITAYGAALGADNPRAAVGTYPTGRVDRPLWQLVRNERLFVRKTICDLMNIEHDRDVVRALNARLLLLPAEG